jgi:integrase
MASIRPRARTDGSGYFSVVYRLNGKQTSTSFADFTSAKKFADLANKFGPENALSTVKAADSTLTSMTIEQWLNRHIENLTGVDINTRTKYRAFVRNDLGPAFGELPLTALAKEHISQWVNSMGEPDEDGKQPSAKTIRNKHMFLAGALNAAVAAGRIPSNPCMGIRLPRDEEVHEMLFLTHEQFATLVDAVTPHWKPLVEFLVASGCRWGEAVAVQPGDINLDAGTVRISRSWKHGSGGYRIGATKTSKSRRTINVPKSVLNKLDRSHEWVFVNRDGGPVRIHGFTPRVWAKAVERAWPSVDASGNPINPSKILRPRIHDLRHTCASWLIQAGVPLPVIQDHFGHESITTTVRIYGHLDRRSMQAAADAIGAALGG